MTFDELCAAAQQGDPDAQFELGGFWWERNNYAGLPNVPFGYRTVFPEMKAIPLPFTIRKKMKC